MVSFLVLNISRVRLYKFYYGSAWMINFVNGQLTCENYLFFQYMQLNTNLIKTPIFQKPSNCIKINGHGFTCDQYYAFFYCSGAGHP